MSDWDNFWNDVGDAVETTVQWVAEAVENVAEAVVDVVEDVAAAVETVAEAVVDVVGDVVEVVVDWTLTVADTVNFDPVDFITGGVIDIDYEDGQLTGELNLGIASVGISVGEQGFGAHAGFDIGIASSEISYDSDAGLAMSGSLGVDWGPLPYAEGHLNIGADGTVSIGGEIQATLPLPFGSIGGGVAGELYRNADGTWGATSLIDVFTEGPLGTGASFHNDAFVELGPGGFIAATNTDVLIDGPRDRGAAFHNDASVALGPDEFAASPPTHFEVDGPFGSGAIPNTNASVEAADGGVRMGTGLEASGIGGEGFDASAEFEETGSAKDVRGASGDDDVVGDGGLSSAQGSDGGAPTEAPAPGPSPDPLAESVRALAGSGDLSEAISSGDTGLAQSVELVETEVLDDFTSAIVNSEINEAAAEEVWDDIGQ